MFCRICQRSDNETQVNDNRSNVNTGCTNRAVPIVMEDIGGYKGLQKEDERNEKLREIPEPADG